MFFGVLPGQEQISNIVWKCVEKKPKKKSIYKILVYVAT